tara:strand:+ start:42278 stop:42562 length:285 start_codon:yes stop_codon:yes gene_type:complete
MNENEKPARWVETDCPDFDPSGPIIQAEPIPAEITLPLIVAYQNIWRDYQQRLQARGFPPDVAENRAWQQTFREAKTLLGDEKGRELMIAVGFS